MIQEELKNKEKDLKGITRQACSLLDTAWTKGYAAGFNDGYATRREADKEIMETKRKWIPVSEELPEEKLLNPSGFDFEDVLCTTIWGDVRTYKFGKPIGHDKPHFWLGGGIMDEYVIAWQPLPKPYKEADND